MSDRIQRQHRYTITPEHLILDPEVDDRAFRLWCRLDRYAGDNGAAFPYRETLSVELDCSLSSVDRAIEKLVKAGWLTKERMAAGDRNTYTLLVVPERTVLVRVKKVRAEREAKWAGQRRRKPSDTPTAQVDEGGVVTGEDRGGVVTGDERVSSPTTTGVVTGDAHKEASPIEHQGMENHEPADAASPGDADVVPISKAKSSRRASEPDASVAEIEPIARKIVNEYHRGGRKIGACPRTPSSSAAATTSSRSSGSPVARTRRAEQCHHVAEALIKGYTEKQVKKALADWASGKLNGGRKPQGTVPSRGAWTSALAAVVAGRDAEGGRAAYTNDQWEQDPTGGFGQAALGDGN
jgi:hypothetical protein